MAVDLIGIIGHDLSKAELRELPFKVDSSRELKDFFEDFHSKKIKIKSKWNLEFNEENLKMVWALNESRGEILVPVNYETNILSSFFGDLYINRSSLIISLNEHKYANLQEPKMANYIFQINRKIAQIFNQEKIIYSVESAFPQSMIYGEAIAGLIVDEIVDFAKEEFGTIETDLNKGMKNLIFIDDFKNEIGELKEWNWTEIKQ